MLGLLVGFAGYLLRRHILEIAPAERSERMPIIETLHDHWPTVLRFAGLSVYNAVGFYVSFVYLVSWLQVADGIPPDRALEINSLSMALLLPIMIATGLLTDRFGRTKLFFTTLAIYLLATAATAFSTTSRCASGSSG